MRVSALPCGVCAHHFFRHALGVSSFRSAYPAAWSDDERHRAEYLADLFEARVQELRDARRRGVLNRPISWRRPSRYLAAQYVAAIPGSAWPLLRCCFPSIFSAGHRQLIVSGVRVVVHLHSDLGLSGDEVRFSLGAHFLPVEVFPPPLPAPAQEVYLRLRLDGLPPVEAAEAAALV